MGPLEYGDDFLNQPTETDEGFTIVTFASNGLGQDTVIIEHDVPSDVQTITVDGRTFNRDYTDNLGTIFSAADDSDGD